MTIIKLLGVSILLTTIGFVRFVYAEPYAVEVIVFENTAPDSSAGELWTKVYLPPEPGNVLETESKLTADSTLSPIVGLLEADANYRVLYYDRWVQEVKTKSVSQPVHIYDNFFVIGTEDVYTPQRLSGFVRLYRGRFLQFEANIVYRPFSTNYYGAETVGLSNQNRPPQNYSLHQKRRIKTKEIHYFDHPKFGVLLTVVPEEN